MTTLFSFVFRGQYVRAHRLQVLRHRHFTRPGAFGRKTYALVKLGTQKGVRFAIFHGAGDALHPVTGFEHDSKFIPFDHAACYESEKRARHAFVDLLERQAYPPDPWLRGPLETCGRLLHAVHGDASSIPGIGQRFEDAAGQARQVIEAEAKLTPRQKTQRLQQIRDMQADLHAILADHLQRGPFYLAVLTARNPWRKDEPAQSIPALLAGSRREAWMKAVDHISGGAHVQSLRPWTGIAPNLQLGLGDEQSSIAEAEAYAYLDSLDSPELRQQSPFSSVPAGTPLSRFFQENFHYRLWEGFDAAVARARDLRDPQPKFPVGTPVVLCHMFGAPLYRGSVEGARIGAHGKETLARLTWSHDGRGVGEVKAFRLLDQTMLDIDHETVAVPRRLVHPPERS